MIRVFTYARFSSDLQNDKSNADQHRENRAFAARQDGWTITREFEDAAISGASLMRPDFQAMMRGLSPGSAIWSWPSRWIASAATKSTSPGSTNNSPSSAFASSPRTTVRSRRSTSACSDDERAVSQGPGGQDLARSASGGRAREVGPGPSYGYRYDRSRLVTAKRGEVTGKGCARHSSEEAAVVLRILKLYVAGLSPEAIAKLMNAESIPGPGSD